MGFEYDKKISYNHLNKDYLIMLRKLIKNYQYRESKDEKQKDLMPYIKTVLKFEAEAEASLTEFTKNFEEIDGGLQSIVDGEGKNPKLEKIISVACYGIWGIKDDDDLICDERCPFYLDKIKEK